MILSAKKWMISFILGCVVMFMFVGLSHAQDTLVTGQELWTYSHHGYNRDDQADDVYFDVASNCVYLSGYERTYTNRYKYTVVCLNATTGAEIWKYELGGGIYEDQCRAYAVVVGLDGYVYSAGQYFSDGPNNAQQMRIVKHNPANGDAVHTWTYDWHVGSAGDFLYDIEYGWDHKIYVCGRNRYQYYGVYRFCVVQLDTNLSYATDVFWTYYDTGGNSSAAVIKPDQAQNCIWVGGYVYNPSTTSMDFAVVKLSTAMTLLGAYYYDGGYGDDACADIALPYTGTGIYACGYTTGFGQGNNFMVASIPASCTPPANYVYTKDGTASGEDKANEIEVGASNYTYSCGWFTNTGQNKDFAVVSTSSSGLRWMYTINGVDNLDDYAYDLELNAASNRVFTTGFVLDIIDGNEEDLIVKKLSSAGTAYWTYYYDKDGDERGIAIDVASDGNVYVAGKMEVSPYAYCDFAGLALNQNFVPTVPTLISPADAGYLNDTSVTFIWNSCIDIETSVSGYYLAYSMDLAMTTYDSVWSTDTTETVVLTDTAWYWAVKTKDSEGGQSAYSGIWSFSFDLTNPVAPVLTSPINDAYEFDTTVTFNWQAITLNRELPSPVTYIIQIDTTAGFSSPIKTDTTGSTTIDEELLSGEYYYYWHVKAYDAAGNDGSYSGAETFMVDLNNPLIDSTYHIGYYPGPFDIFSKVTDIWGIDEVLLYYKRLEDPAWFSVAMTEGSGNWYQGQIPALTLPPDTVKYYVYATDNTGKETRAPSSGHYWFIPPAVEESEETLNIFSFNVRSNLIKGKAIFNLSLPRSASVTLEIYDASGRRIATPATGMKSAGNHTITWTPKANGIYFYSLKSPWKAQRGKMLIVH